MDLGLHVHRQQGVVHILSLFFMKTRLSPDPKTRSPSCLHLFAGLSFSYWVLSSAFVFRIYVSFSSWNTIFPSARMIASLESTFLKALLERIPISTGELLPSLLHLVEIQHFSFSSSSFIQSWLMVYCLKVSSGTFLCFGQEEHPLEDHFHLCIDATS